MKELFYLKNKTSHITQKPLHYAALLAMAPITMVVKEERPSVQTLNLQGAHVYQVLL